jgi:hypothetical protein
MRQKTGSQSGRSFSIDQPRETTREGVKATLGRRIPGGGHGNAAL